MLLGGILSLFFFLFTYYSSTYWELVFCRFMFGILFSLTVPISCIYISEISSKEIRGRVIIFLNFFFIAGKIYLIWVMSIFMNTLVEG